MKMNTSNLNFKLYDGKNKLLAKIEFVYLAILELRYSFE